MLHGTYDLALLQSPSTPLRLSCAVLSVACPLYRTACAWPQEEEAEQMMAPEDFVNEEERLREEREAAARAEAEQVRERSRPESSLQHRVAGGATADHVLHDTRACAPAVPAFPHPTLHCQTTCLPCLAHRTPPSPRAQAAKDAETVLSQQRFAQLDALLNKAGMYTQFLTEQMQAYAAPASGSAQEGGEAEEEAAAEEDDAAAGGRQGCCVGAVVGWLFDCRCCSDAVAAHIARAQGHHLQSGSCIRV